MLAVGAKFHQRYRILNRIGSGGMGVVYEVLDEVTGRRRALKVMLPGFVDDPDARRRFTLEATVAAQVKSEQIVEVFDAGIDADTDCPFLVMELLSGLDLEETLRRCGAFPPRVVLRLVRQLAAALEATHARGIIHRDLKPDNLFLVRRQDGTLHLRIVDFGIAKLAQGRDGKTTLCVGTPLYMAPEQIRGDGSIDARADIYSLAQVTLTLLLGRPYFELLMGEAAPAHEVMMRVLVGSKAPPHIVAEPLGIKLPAKLETWFLRATHRERDKRYDRLDQFVHELQSAFALVSKQDELRWIGFLEKLHHEVRLAEDRSFDSVPSRSRGAVVRQPAARSTPAARGLSWVSAMAAAGLTATFAAWNYGPELRLSAAESASVKDNKAGSQEAFFASKEPGALLVTDEIEKPQDTSTRLMMHALTAEAPGTPLAPGAPLVNDTPLATDIPLVTNPKAQNTQLATQTPRPRSVLQLDSVVQTKQDEARCQVPYFFDQRGIKRYRVECVTGTPGRHVRTSAEL